MPEAAPEVEVIIEVPRGSFIKRGSDFEIDFVSPLPLPYNYGAVPTMIGLEGDLLDAVVLGPRLALGSLSGCRPGARSRSPIAACRTIS